MKITDIIPIFVIVAALLVNLAIGVSNNVDFPVLMIRCIIVTVVFGILSYMLTKTITNAVEYSRLSKLEDQKEQEETGDEDDRSFKENKSLFDIKVPPLDDAEFLRMDSGSDDDFIEVNPVHMDTFNKNGHR